MEKKKIMKRTIIIIVAILLLLFMVHTIRNYIIINKVVSVQDNFLKSDNHSYIIEMPKNPEEPALTRIRICYRDGKSKLEIGRFDENEKMLDGFSDWCDIEKKEYIHLGQSGKDATISEFGDDLKGFDMLLTFSENKFLNKLKHAIFSDISYDEVNEDKCYKIKLFTTGVDNELYYKVANGEIAKLYMPGENRNENGEKIADGSFILFKNFETNSLTEEEMARPDLTGYNVTERRVIPLDEYETYDDEDE